MNIKIKTLKGDHFNVCIQQSSCFLDVKKHIQNIKHIPVDKQKLIYKSKQPQDNAILFEIGVKNDDNMVLMKLIPKPIKTKKQKSLVEEAQKKKQKDTIKGEQKKIQKLVKLGYSKKIAEEILKKNNFNFQKSLEQLSKKKQTSNEISINDILRKQFERNLQNNQDYSQNNQNEIKFTGDLESLAGLLGQNNQKLQQMINDNPQVLQELLQGYGQAQAEQIEGFQGLQQQYQTHIQFTQTEEEAIQRLINLGFNRENVVPAYLACEKNEEMTANMLFNQQENGDFDNQNN